MSVIIAKKSQTVKASDKVIKSTASENRRMIKDLSKMTEMEIAICGARALKK